MARSAATWTKLGCEGADITFREHWGGFVEIACGEAHVMVCHAGLQRLAKLPPESAIALLRELLEIAHQEQRNRADAEVLSAYIERSLAHRRSDGE
jgi:hypothetical protein